MDRTLSAGGKLFLAGEYAVLWGGAAWIAAVEPRVHARVRTRDDRRVDLLLPGTRFSGHATPAGVRWDGEVPDACLFAARAVDLVLRAVGRDGPGLQLALEPSPEFVPGEKLGLGGSARTAVLATEAARSAVGRSLDSARLALAAHWIAQGGRGSGGDVAAIFAGGLVRYRRYDVGRLAQAARQGDLASALGAAPPVDLVRAGEPRLPWVWVYTGAGASTRALISEVESRLGPAARDAFVGRSDALGQQLEVALTRGDYPSAADAVEQLEALLRGLGNLETEAITRVLGLAATYGCAGKMSGAGGGDGCVVVCPDDEAKRRLLEGLGARGLFAVSPVLAAGLRGEAAGHAELGRWLDAAE